MSALVPYGLASRPGVSSSVSYGRDPQGRRPIEACAVCVERRPVHRLVAGAARSGGVSAAMAEAGLMTHQHLTGTEVVPAWAVLWCPHHPCPCSGDESWPTTGMTPRGRAQNSERRSHQWPGGLGGDHQHPAVPSATTAAKAAIFAEHACPSARTFEPKLRPRR